MKSQIANRKSQERKMLAPALRRSGDSRSGQSGFTLIELLIVISIIGILSATVLVGLGSGRAAARDARRLSDLRQVQNALALYYNQCGFYPGLADCGVGTVSYTNNDPPDGLEASLKSVGVSRIPSDPTNSGDYKYSYAASNDFQHYALSAKLESNNPALNDDIDNAQTEVNNDIPPINCADAQNYYCTGE